MKERILKFLMVKGIRIFTDNVPTWVIRSVFKNEVDHIRLRNGLNTAAAIAASQSWKGVI
jgi:hypothetical protein